MAPGKRSNQRNDLHTEPAHKRNEFMTIRTNHKASRRDFVQKVVETGAGMILASGIFKHFGGTAYAAEASYDVVVIGSGAAGMTAALTASKRGLKVLVVEKASKFGGSTARSGGGIWIRNNAINNEAGLVDSTEEAAEYLARVVDGSSPAENQAAFLREGPRMIDFLRKNTPLRFQYVPGYSDYYPELPGGKAEGASIEPEVFDGNILGSELKNLNPPAIATPPGVVIYTGDYKWLCLAKVSLEGAKRAARAVSRYVEKKLRGQTPLSMGQALAAGLRAGLMQAGVPVWLDTPLLDLSVDADGRVDGVVVSRAGVNTLIRARKGVVIASGGFERNAEMRAQYQKKPIGVDWTLGAKENTGDGIRAGERVGADIALTDEAWWGPSILFAPGQPYFCLSERSMPGSIMVNSDGVRFVNESAPYHDVVNAMYRQKRVGDDLPIWLITDHHYRQRYLFRDVLPGFPLPKEWYENGAVFSAPSIENLADMIHVPAEELQSTITAFNDSAEKGMDPIFGRGDSAYDRYYADPGVKPNPSLAPLRKGPFYAFRMVPGDLGTKGGLKTNAKAQVIRPDGSEIAGLYAAGNATSSVMGKSYAGNGATLGPAMTFGFIAANDLAAN